MEDHKNHQKKLILAESLDGVPTEYPYVYIYFCNTCGKWYDPKGIEVNMSKNRTFGSSNEDLPLCYKCGSKLIYDAIRGCGVCTYCLTDTILPLDF